MRVGRFTFSVLEWACCLFVAPVLLFPTVKREATILALLLLGLVWVLRVVLLREAWPVTPFSLALFFLGQAIIVGAMVSSYPSLTLPKLTNLLLGLALFRSTVFFLHHKRFLGLSLLLFFGIALGFALVGAFTTHWPTQKVPWLSPIVRHLPRMPGRLPELPSSFVNPNQLAVVPLLYVPLALSLLKERPYHELPARWGRAITVGLTLLAVMGLLIVFLAQSRAGWLGGTGAIGTLLFLWRRTSRRLWARAAPVIFALLLFGGILAIFFYMGPREVLSLLTERQRTSVAAQVFGRSDMKWRWEVWHQALQIIRAFPWTGIGLGTYRRLAQHLYPSPYLATYPQTVFDAHQMLLQVAVDLGLGGLIAYLALVGIALKATWQNVEVSSPLKRSVAIGTFSSLVGLHLYGLLNSMTMGSKPGLLFWFILALIGGIITAPARGRVNKNADLKPHPGVSPI